MANKNELSEAKAAILDPELTDPEYDYELSLAKDYELKLERERNRHKELMKDKELGVIGRILGGTNHAPFSVAVVSIFLGVIASLIVGVVALIAGSQLTDAWMAGFTLASGALGYVFGQGQNK